MNILDTFSTFVDDLLEQIEDGEKAARELECLKGQLEIVDTIAEELITYQCEMNDGDWDRSTFLNGNLDRLQQAVERHRKNYYKHNTEEKKSVNAYFFDSNRNHYYAIRLLKDRFGRILDYDNRILIEDRDAPERYLGGFAHSSYSNGLFFVQKDM